MIESVFGKLKRLEQDQAKSGFTRLLQSVSAMVSTTTEDVVQKAIETVPTKRVLVWCKENIGQSAQAKRKEAVISHDKTEQKWGQFSVVLWTSFSPPLSLSSNYLDFFLFCVNFHLSIYRF
jgi:hypothetical protein